MGFFNFINNLFKPKKDYNLVTVYLKDNKCGNKMKLVLRKSYDIHRVYDKKREEEFKLTKVVICDKCYHKIKVELGFDKSYNIITKDIKGGTLITEEEYNS
ncbi:hypothetical protein [Halothermothrix orenii]|uniref:Uncharacterized protein n=1 Tax=Halothermothrix orenii (strain H 168 / OCM 544 / DSM 9562) TaxID=373903 RepID=B8CX00_HALOH|nr:hypothetical protein [Halothermothrix orenii]ACL69819.1 hypothetical protein Hore_10640 [Halothermothrix orenii H 168]